MFCMLVMRSYRTTMLSSSTSAKCDTRRRRRRRRSTRSARSSDMWIVLPSDARRRTALSVVCVVYVCYCVGIVYYSYVCINESHFNKHWPGRMHGTTVQCIFTHYGFVLLVAALALKHVDYATSRVVNTVCVCCKQCAHRVGIQYDEFQRSRSTVSRNIALGRH